MQTEERTEIRAMVEKEGHMAWRRHRQKKHSVQPNHQPCLAVLGWLEGTAHRCDTQIHAFTAEQFPPCTMPCPQGRLVESSPTPSPRKELVFWREAGKTGHAPLLLKMKSAVRLKARDTQEKSYCERFQNRRATWL